MIDHSTHKWICNAYQLSPNQPQTLEEQSQTDEWVKEMIHDKNNSRVFKEKIYEFKEEVKYQQHLIDAYCHLLIKAGNAAWRVYPEAYLEHHRKKLRFAEGQKDRFGFLYKVSTGRAEMKEVNLEVIKKISIGQFMTGPPRGTQTRQSFCCPLHNEDTPSFVWYVDSNTFHCFGCGAGSDVIDLFMGLYKVDFKEAIKELGKLI